MIGSRRSRFQQLADDAEGVTAPLELLDLAEALEVAAVVEGDPPFVVRRPEQPFGLVGADELDADPCRLGELVDPVVHARSSVGEHVSPGNTPFT